MTALVGLTVVETRKMTDDEMDEMSWHPDEHTRPTVLVLDDGAVLFPSHDDEKNEPGDWETVDVDGVSQLEGETIDHASPMTDEYMEYLEWTEVTAPNPTVIQFGDGQAVYPLADSAGTTAGVLFGFDDDGQLFDLQFIRADE